MKIIALANQKGGCGKTTTAVNLSHALSLLEKKVLLIDADPQHHTTTALGYTNARNTLLDLFDRITKHEEFSLKDFLQHRNVFLSVIPSEFELGAIEAELSGNTIALELIERAIAKIAPGEYDYVVIDCPPNLGFLTLNALKMAHLVITPFDAGIFSLMGTDNLKKILSMLADVTHKSPDVRALLTMFDGRSNFSRSFYDDAKAKFGDKLFLSIIRNNAHLRESAACARTIFEHAPKSNGAHDYAQFAAELVNHFEKTRAVEFSLPGYPEARNVYIAGDFSQWQISEDHKMKRGSEGWKLSLPLEKGKSYKYKFVIDDFWVADNRNPDFELDSLGFKNSLVNV
jgi:chromosome partitioning protein